MDEPLVLGSQDQCRRLLLQPKVLAPTVEDLAISADLYNGNLWKAAEDFRRSGMVPHRGLDIDRANHSEETIR